MTDRGATGVGGQANRWRSICNRTKKRLVHKIFGREASKTANGSAREPARKKRKPKTAILAAKQVTLADSF